MKEKEMENVKTKLVSLLGLMLIAGLVCTFGPGHPVVSAIQNLVSLA
jgi:hypothetical protein